MKPEVCTTMYLCMFARKAPPGVELAAFYSTRENSQSPDIQRADRSSWRLAKNWCRLGTVTKSSLESCLAIGGALPLRSSADASHSDPCACWCPWREGLRPRTPTAKGLGESSVQRDAGVHWRNDQKYLEKSRFAVNFL